MNNTDIEVIKGAVKYGALWWAVKLFLTGWIIVWCVICFILRRKNKREQDDK